MEWMDGGFPLYPSGSKVLSLTTVSGKIGTAGGHFVR